MNIDQQLQMLTEWVNDYLPNNVERNHNSHVRDISQYRSKTDLNHAIVWGQPPVGFDVNHGWGKLKEGDVQVHEIQIRRYDYPASANISFEQHKQGIRII